MKIISTVPSQTELLFHLGLDKEVIGITKFCIHPSSWHKNKHKIGGTKNLHVQEIINMRPDLVIANKEENTKSEIEEIQKHCNTYISDIENLEDTYKMISEIGRRTDTSNKSDQIIKEIIDGFAKLKSNDFIRKSVAYLIWQDPIMVVGDHTFINEMIKHNNWHNVFSDKSRYPITTLEELSDMHPDYILLSTEPYPFKEKHRIHFQQLLPSSKVIILDGEYFSWYGSRLIDTSKYFMTLQKSLLV